MRKTTMRDITITIPGHLVQPLVGLVDAGLRSSGLRAAKDAAAFASLLEDAVARQNEEEAGTEVARSDAVTD